MKGPKPKAKKNVASTNLHLKLDVEGWNILTDTATRLSQSRGAVIRMLIRKYAESLVTDRLLITTTEKEGGC